MIKVNAEKKNNRRGVKLFTLLLICAVLLASLSGCLTSCGLYGGDYLTSVMDELFTSILSGDALSVNILISDPTSFGLENEEATLPLPNMDKADYESSMSSITEICSLLLNIDYSSLSQTQKCDFDTVMNYFYTYSEYADYYYLQDNYLGSTGGWNVNLPIYLDKYAFYDKHDVNNWISLAEQTYTAFPKYVEFEQIRIEAGYGRADYVYSGIAKQAESMAATKDGEDHFLIGVFNDKLADCDFLTDAEKADYASRARTAITTKLVPAYTSLASSVTLLVGNVNNNNQGLSHFEGGRDYYELLFKDYASTSDAVPTAYLNLTNAYNNGLSRARSIYSTLAEKGMSSTDVSDALDALEDDADLSKTALEGYYTTLKASYTQDFPALPSSVPDADFKEVPSAMSDFYNPASYFKSAVDSASAEETIYVNSASSSGYLGFDLIAHEGIPGHQLQHSYYKTSGAHLLRTVLGYTGYAEGWATHAQYYSAKYYGDNETDRLVYELYLLNDELTLYILTLIDMDVNYYGASKDELVSSYASYGFSETGLRNVYEYVAENPAVYTSYGYGYYKMSKLRASYSGTDMAFHTSVLSIGPTSYEILEKYL